MKTHTEKRPTLVEARDLRKRLARAEEKAMRLDALALALTAVLGDEIQVIAEQAANEAVGDLRIER